jgi:phage regulator Rha-like protein
MIFGNSAKVEELEKEIYNLERDHNKDLSNLRKDCEIIIARKDAEVDVKIAQATAELKKELAEKTAECSNYKKETEILTKAFENLGFDVKDMKDILNKLVDGVVSKNQIQLINNGNK